MIKSLLEKILAQNSCIYFPPSAEENVLLTNQQLSELGFASLPPDFTILLSVCDGFYYDGLEILGVKPHPRPVKNYIFAGLAEVNRPFAEYAFFKGKVIIGRMSENIIVYDDVNKLFAIIDRVNLCSQVEFSDFGSLLASLLRLCDIEN